LTAGGSPALLERHGADIAVTDPASRRIGSKIDGLCGIEHQPHHVGAAEHGPRLQQRRMKGQAAVRRCAVGSTLSAAAG